MSLMNQLSKCLKKCDRIYVPYHEIRLRRRERNRMLADAASKFEREKPEHGSLEDYKRALYRHRVFYGEYMYAFEFWKKDEKKRNEFISDREMMCIYRKTVLKSVFQDLKNKVTTLQLFEKYVHRKWLYVPDSTYDAFESMVSTTDCIAKPLQGMKGKGVFKIEKNTDADLHDLYLFCCKNNMLIEECVRSCGEIEEFHPQSLNTVRVVTVSKDGKCELLGAMLRMGVKNSVVDNSSSGGVVASIDVDTGEIISLGVDKNGNQFEKHPDSGKRIKGFVIPNWSRIVRMCKELPMLMPEMVFAGWDIAVLPDGNLELIEANAVPLVSGGLQSPTKVGLKSKLCSVGKEVLGFNPLKLVSVWSKSYIKYEDSISRH